MTQIILDTNTRLPHDKLSNEKTYAKLWLLYACETQIQANATLLLVDFCATTEACNT
jgi:hypothetical protein